MPGRKWDGTAEHARVINAATKYCDDCGHSIDRHERGKDRTYVCNFYGCACKTSKLRVKREGGEK